MLVRREEKGDVRERRRWRREDMGGWMRWLNWSDGSFSIPRGLDLGVFLIPINLCSLGEHVFSSGTRC